MGLYLLRHRGRVLGFFASASLLWGFYRCLPEPMFPADYCTVLQAQGGELLGATIARDGQYRFPPLDSVPLRFKECALAFEDRYFYWHPGINPVALLRAAMANLRAGTVVQGGSTLTMQVARMMHPGAPRTLANKLIEMLWALRLELAYSKEEIMALWANNAPFGGNVVGLSAAAWRYYAQSPYALSWAQLAALAALPNAPGAIYPGEGNTALRAKRDAILHTLLQRGTLDSAAWSLAREESLPSAPIPLPQLAPHLLTRAQREGLKGQMVHTTIDARLQQEAQTVVANMGQHLAGGAAHNAGVVIADVSSGALLAYVGNVPGLGARHNGHVDMVTAPRSSASVIKPFLYAGMLEDGLLLPKELVFDTPLTIGAFSPQNASHSFSGVVEAHRALAQSLNVPIVRMLHRYGVGFFLELLHKLGFPTLNHPPSHYGLSLVLGGGEITLDNVAGAYASLARTLNGFLDSGHYSSQSVRPLHYRLAPASSEPHALGARPPLGAGPIYLTLQALREVNRPEEQAGWRYLSSTRAVAWKTGTSFGGRDAWAVGVNPHYVVGVWVGNSDGHGVSDLSGLRSAAPLMFRLWDLLPPAGWFAEPLGDLEVVKVCEASGMLPSEHCPLLRNELVPARAGSHAPCPYHRAVHLDRTGTYRVDATGYPVQEMQTVSWFVLPPTAAWYCQRHRTNYRPLPPWMPGCAGSTAEPTMQFIYPRVDRAQLSVPRARDGKPSTVLFEVSHVDSESTVYWHLDGTFVGQTYHFHQLALQPTLGHHTITAIDASGQRIAREFYVIYRAH